METSRPAFDCSFDWMISLRILAYSVALSSSKIVGVSKASILHLATCLVGTKYLLECKPRSQARMFHE